MQELGIAPPPHGPTSPSPPRDGTGSARSPAAGPSSRPEHAASPPSSAAGTFARRERAEPAPSHAAAPPGRPERTYDCTRTAPGAHGPGERSAGECARLPGAQRRAVETLAESDQKARGAAPALEPGELDGIPSAASPQGDAHEAAGHAVRGLGANQAAGGSQTAPAGACLELLCALCLL